MKSERPRSVTGESTSEPITGPTTPSGVSSSTPHWRWLESTRILQEEAYDVNFSRFTTNPDELADSIIENHTALIVELSEFMNEVGWKTWSTPRGWVNHDAAVGELVDAAHFLANILVRLGVTDEEWERRYQRKQEINRNRQRSGYDTRVGKCPRCRRAYDDPGVECYSVEPNYSIVLSSGDRATAWCDRDEVYVS